MKLESLKCRKEVIFAEKLIKVLFGFYKALKPKDNYYYYYYYYYYYQFIFCCR